MIIELPDSKIKIDVRIVHWQEPDGSRITQVTAFNIDQYHVIAEGRSHCGLRDNFCKLTGRKIACIRMFKYQADVSNPTLAPVWSKADRQAIFQAVCPSFFKQKKREKAIPGS